MGRRQLADASGPGAQLLMSLEILHFLLVLFGGRPGLEGAHVAAFARLGVFLAGIDAKFAGSQSADDGCVLPKPSLAEAAPRPAHNFLSRRQISVDCYVFTH